MGFGKDGKGVIIRDRDTITLGALSTISAIKQGAPLAITEDFRMLKGRLYWELEAGTFVAGDGPILLGICNDELSAVEIAEAINADGPLGPDDAVGGEQAERAVFLLEQDPIVFTEELGADREGFQQGVVDVTQRWTYYNNSGWSLFAYNMGSGGLTTGGLIRLNATYYGVWVT